MIAEAVLAYRPADGTHPPDAQGDYPLGGPVFVRLAYIANPKKRGALKHMLVLAARHPHAPTHLDPVHIPPPNELTVLLSNRLFPAATWPIQHAQAAMVIGHAGKLPPTDQLRDTLINAILAGLDMKRAEATRMYNEAKIGMGR